MKKNKIKLHDLNFDLVTMEQAIDYIYNLIYSNKKGYIITPNVDHIINISKDKKLKKIYDRSLMLLADGMPLVFLSKFVSNTPIPERVTGSDLLIKFVASSQGNSKIKIMLAGGLKGANEQAIKNFKKLYNNLPEIHSYYPPFGFEKDKNEEDKFIYEINKIKPDIIFFGVGSPKQEIWISENIDKIEKGIFICVGAAMDFAAGYIKRSPKIISNIGLEWLWRLLNDPLRLWKRYLLKDMYYIVLAIKEIFKKNN